MGGTATPYQTDKFQELDITVTFSSLHEMQNQINAILGSSSGGPAGPPGSGSSGIAQITAKITATASALTVRWIRSVTLVTRPRWT